MQTATVVLPDAHRRPGGLELVAGLLLLGAVVLHVVAMVPGYFATAAANQSLISQPDQAALYAVLAAAWALALIVGLTGPARTPVAAALAVGIAVTELGFRVADLGDVARYGAGTAGAGLWLMEAAWVVGAAGAVAAVFAARRRHGNIALERPRAEEQVAPAILTIDSQQPFWDLDWSAPAELPANPYGEAAEPAVTGPRAAEEAAAADAPTMSLPLPSGAAEPTTSLLPASSRGGDTSVLTPIPGDDTHDAQERNAWTLLVVILALLVAGAFLPSWDHYVGVSSVTGRTTSFSLGNAFSGPWQQVVGTVLAALALAVVPIVAIRLHNRAVAAAAVCGGLLVLASQFVTALVQVDQPVSPSIAGVTPSQASQLGLHLSVKLSGWFTVDVLAAYALFAAIMVWATLRVLQEENSPGTRPSAPELRSDAIPWAS